MVLPAYSIAYLAAPAAVMVAIIVRMKSFAVTPQAKAPTMLIRIAARLALPQRLRAENLRDYEAAYSDRGARQVRRVLLYDCRRIL